MLEVFDVLDCIRWWRISLCIGVAVGLAAVLCVFAGVPIALGILLSGAGCGAVAGILWEAVSALVRWVQS